MEVSPYLKVYPYPEKPGYYLFFSTRTTAVLLVSEATQKAMAEKTLAPAEVELLSRYGVLVPDQKKEKEAVWAGWERMTSANPALNLMLVVNFDCNFACRYCYEGEGKGKLYMSPETGEQTFQFIKKNFSPAKKKLLVDFYGGEPLLSPELIKSLSRELKDFTYEKGASFSFNLITNGSLFTRKVAEELVPLGLERVKITLDGPEEVHNHYRPFKSGAGSFSTLIKNIKATWDLVKISLGGNFEEHNYPEFVRLLDFLMAEGLTPDKIEAIKFDPVFKPRGDALIPVDYKGGCISMDEPWLNHAAVFLREEILKRGYKTAKISPVFCLVDNRDGLVVNFDGKIYKCPAFLGKEEFAIGDVEQGIRRDYSEVYRLNWWKEQAECRDCVYLPLCFGGCRYMSFLQNGKISTLDCRKPHLEATLPAFLCQEVKYKK